MSLQPCGTPAAYRRHLRRGEVACSACKKAHARQSLAAYRQRKQSVTPPRELVPCGTPAAYRRHLNRGEVTCRACCAAHAARWLEYKRSRAAA